MRFYPFGSSSLNQVYNSAVIVTASVSNYAASASYGLTAVTASYALSGSPGIPGTPGSCSYLPGPQGPTGSTGLGGAIGGISIPYPSGPGF
jgi:hypothetical protein